MESIASISELQRDFNADGFASELVCPNSISYYSYVKTATLTETKNRLSALVDRVRQGETILILDRGRPVARLSSVIADDSTGAQGRASRLERQGILRRASTSKSSDLFDQPRPKAQPDGSILTALLSERREGR